MFLSFHHICTTDPSHLCGCDTYTILQSVTSHIVSGLQSIGIFSIDHYFDFLVGVNGPFLRPANWQISINASITSNIILRYEMSDPGPRGWKRG